MKEKFILFFAALSLSILFLGCNLDFQSQRSGYYRNKFIENNTPQVTGKSLQELEFIGKDLRAYLFLGQDNLLTRHFDENEVSHMRDVYKLFFYMRILMALSIIVCLGSLRFLIKKGGFFTTIQKLGKHLIGVLVLLALFVGLVSLNFNRAFIIFHKVLFSNDLWLMDPNKDLMIQMLPENFFADMARNIAFGTIGLILLFALLGLFIGNKEKKNETKHLY